jgi:hypothetical protein
LDKKGDEKKKLKFDANDEVDDRCQSMLIADNCYDTIVGSDHTVADINLRGALIAPIHACVYVDLK